MSRPVASPMAQPQKSLSEDWLSVWIGLGVFVLALGVVAGADLLGWVVRTAGWTDVSKALLPVSPVYKGIGGWGAPLPTYGFLLLVITAGPAAPKAHLKALAAGLPPAFVATYPCCAPGTSSGFSPPTPPRVQKL